MQWKSGPTSFIVPEFVRSAARTTWQSSTRTTKSTQRSPMSPATSSMPGADGVQRQPTCYTPKALDKWASRAKLWAEGQAPDDLPAQILRAKSPSSRATFSSTSSHPEGPRAARRDGVHGAGQRLSKSQNVRPEPGHQVPFPAASKSRNKGGSKSGRSSAIRPGPKREPASACIQPRRRLPRRATCLAPAGRR